MVIDMDVLMDVVGMCRVMLDIMLTSVHGKRVLAVVSGASVGWLMFVVDHWQVSNMLRMDIMASLNHTVSMVNYWYRMVDWDSVDNGGVVHGGVVAFCVVGGHWVMADGVVNWLLNVRLSVGPWCI